MGMRDAELIGGFLGYVKVGTLSVNRMFLSAEISGDGLVVVSGDKCWNFSFRYESGTIEKHAVELVERTGFANERLQRGADLYGGSAKRQGVCRRFEKG